MPNQTRDDINIAFIFAFVNDISKIQYRNISDFDRTKNSDNFHFAISLLHFNIGIYCMFIANGYNLKFFGKRNAISRIFARINCIQGP